MLSKARDSSSLVSQKLLSRKEFATANSNVQYNFYYFIRHLFRGHDDFRGQK